MAPPPKRPPKRRKVDGDGSNRSVFPASDKAKDIKSSDKGKDIKSSKVTESQRNDFSIKDQEAKDYAVRQAEEDGCTGNYRIIDSSFRNFMLPVIPSKADLLK